MKQLIAVFAILSALACAGNRAPSPQVASTAGATASAPDAHAGHNMGATDHRAAEKAFLFPDGDDKGWSTVENGIQHEAAPEVPLSLLPPDTRKQLLRQLSLTIEVVRKFPTVKEAEAAGYRRAGPFLPGLGTHYVGGATNRTGTLTDAEILSPSTIVYDGTAPDSPIAGFMYVSIAMRPGGPQPEGFAGPNDHWHYHTGVCLKAGANGAMEAMGFDGSITEADCRARQGNFMPITQYLLHVWTAPGYSNPLGVFGHANPALRCPDGTYHTVTQDAMKVCRDG